MIHTHAFQMLALCTPDHEEAYRYLMRCKTTLDEIPKLYAGCRPDDPPIVEMRKHTVS